MSRDCLSWCDGEHALFVDYSLWIRFLEFSPNWLTNKSLPNKGSLYLCKGCIPHFLGHTERNFDWFSLVLWRINYYRLFNVKSLFIHIHQISMICKHIFDNFFELILLLSLFFSTKWNGSKYFYVSLIIQLNISHLFGLVWFGLVCRVLWHINLCRLFNAKSIFIWIICSI